MGSRSRYHRFDSLRELERFCCRRFGTLDVRSIREAGSLFVRVGLGDGRHFRRLVVHFEGERTYVVSLPEAEEVAEQQAG
jgi:hypothetical protein